MKRTSAALATAILVASLASQANATQRSDKPTLSSGKPAANRKSFNPQPDPPASKSLGGPDTKSLGGPDTKKPAKH